MRLLIFISFFFLSLNLSAQLIEKIYAQVADKMISFIDLKNYERQLKQNLLSLPALLKGSFTKKNLLKDRKKLLDFMIVREMLFQLAKKRGLPEASQTEVEKTIQKLQGASSHKNFSRKLQKARLDLKKLQENIAINLRIDSLLNQHVASKVTVSEHDIESYHFHKYNRHLFNRFNYEFVLVSFSEDKKPAVLKQLEDQKNIPLENLALSLGLESKKLKLKEEDIQKVLKKELKKLSVSQISPLFKLRGKHHVLQLKWKQAQISPQKMKTKTKIEKQLYQKKLNEEIQKWINKKKLSFPIIQNFP